MRNHLRALSALLPTLVLATAVPAAPAQAAKAPGAHAVTVNQARIGGRGFGTGFGRRSPVVRGRPGVASRRVRNAPSMRRVGRGILQALGIAYLAHLLFGWGAGGSPLGLLLLAGIVFWMVTRAIRRRRPPAYAR